MRRSRSTIIPALVLTGLTAASQGQDDFNVINNYVIPPGVPTVAIGLLGHVEQRGTGPIDVILLPGGGFGGEIWDSFMLRNLDRYTMYAITPAGWGGTAPPAVPAQLEYFEGRAWTTGLVEGIVQLIERESMDHPVVIGHHVVGDHIALRLGLEHADRIRGIVVAAGDPSRPANPSLDGRPQADEMDQIRFVRDRLAGQYRTQSMEEYRAGLLAGRELSIDEARGRYLAERQLRTPSYVYLRYFLEYLTKNLELELDELRIPLLVIDPQLDPDEMIALMTRGLVAKIGDNAEARRQVEQRLIGHYGSLDAAKETFGKDPNWERLRDHLPNLRIEYVPDSRIFVMDDRPDQFDELLKQFIETVDSAP